MAGEFDCSRGSVILTSFFDFCSGCLSLLHSLLLWLWLPDHLLEWLDVSLSLFLWSISASSLHWPGPPSFHHWNWWWPPLLSVPGLDWMLKFWNAWQQLSSESSLHWRTDLRRKGQFLTLMKLKMQLGQAQLWAWWLVSSLPLFAASVLCSMLLVPQSWHITFAFLALLCSSNPITF